MSKLSNVRAARRIEAQLIAQDYLQGHSIKSIAKNRYLSHTTVRVRLREEGIEPMRMHNYDYKRERFIQLWESDMSLEDIVEVLGYASALNVRKAASRYRTQGFALSQRKPEKFQRK